MTFLRSNPEKGLRGARMKGVKAAQGDVIVFLQMPFEVNLNWLPPLLGKLSNVIPSHSKSNCDENPLTYIKIVF